MASRILWFYVWQFVFVLITTTLIYSNVTNLFHKITGFHYGPSNFEIIKVNNDDWKDLYYELELLRKEVKEMRDECQDFSSKLEATFDSFYSDQLGALDYAADYSGGVILNTFDTIPLRQTVPLLGAFSWTTTSKPDVILKAIIPGRCFAFYGSKARIIIKFAHMIILTHVSLEHLRIGEAIDSAPKDFQILALDGESLGSFKYDMSGRIIQTFELDRKNQSREAVELRIVSNYGNEEYTCLYRFRVHSLI